ncbi:AAA family ATPase [Candidatus Micrarchaeota archaeon]|nr:AAA family ATPase [Candidatus Micrarchaeota archaeon]MBD3417589.1 AAA family ATPase [Candidatus Micrarchaeota archaeon]
MRILITGTPGTGKTEVANELGRITGWEVLHISEIAEEAESVRLAPNGEKEVDIPKLSAYITPILNEKADVIFEGHLGCEMPCPAEIVVVLRTNPRKLEKRMEERGYFREKIDENMMAELLDYCYQLSDKHYACTVAELDTSERTPEESAKLVYSYITGDRDALDSVNWEDYLERRTGKPQKEE